MFDKGNDIWKLSRSRRTPSTPDIIFQRAIWNSEQFSRSHAFIRDMACAAHQHRRMHCSKYRYAHIFRSLNACCSISNPLNALARGISMRSAVHSSALSHRLRVLQKRKSSLNTKFGAQHDQFRCKRRCERLYFIGELSAEYRHIFESTYRHNCRTGETNELERKLAQGISKPNVCENDAEENL